MRVLRSIVQPLVLPMLYSWQDFTFRSSITLQFGENDHTRCRLPFLKQLAKKSCGGFFVPSALNQDIKYVAVLIHGSPERVLLAANREDDLIQMPFVTTARTATTQFLGVGLPECEAPLPYCFLAVCRRERFSPKFHPLAGRFRSKCERWSPPFRVEMAVVRASDFLSDKLLGEHDTSASP